MSPTSNYKMEKKYLKLGPLLQVEEGVLLILHVIIASSVLWATADVALPSFLVVMSPFRA